MSPSLVFNASSNGGFYNVSTADDAVYALAPFAWGYLRLGKHEERTPDRWTKWVFMESANIEKNSDKYDTTKIL
ncbi:hypothetical protein QJS10_CPB17g01840 [Acorus calamus]|uniref:Uncharacterized protein n=1 Tax=Acorus calamus TaxID=4465 RepID=A0AAV9CVW1_ACOCL|nr:hypothetical protein QJS10_CPB17g01840 [Acorus calamus]